MTTNLESLEKRLANIEAKSDVETLMYEYLHTCDVSDNTAEIAEFFTEDAIYETQGNLAEMAPTVGKDAIRELFSGVRNILSYSTHFASNPVIHVAGDGNSATGRWYTYEMATTASPKEEIVLLALYENDFVKIAGGWKIQKIRFSDILSFPYSEGWKDIRYVSLVDLKRKGHNE